MYFESCGESLLEQRILLDPGGIGHGTFVGTIARPRGCLGAGGSDTLLEAAMGELVISVPAALLASSLLEKNGVPNQALAEGDELDDGLALHRFESSEAVSSRIFLFLIENEGLCAT